MFYVRVLATEGSSFQECFATWTQYKKFLLEALYDAAVKLEEHTVLSITTEVISVSSQGARGVRSPHIRIDWLDRAIEEFHRVASEHHEFVQMPMIEGACRGTEEAVELYKTSNKVGGREDG